MLFSIVAFKVQLLQEFAGIPIKVKQFLCLVTTASLKYAIMKNSGSAPRFLAVGAVAINMR